ncbi:MAG: peptide ABC transporter substrate-binding protein [Alphaproteobacteria bacterium]|nr:peptide ABC transporter substrate-binding protein [Alphaproteobacteria bacterium]
MSFRTDRRTVLFGAAGLSAAAALNGCANARTIGLDKVRRSLDIANSGEPLSLDPHKASGVWENNIIGNLYMGLTTEGPNAEPMPGLAERWESSEDLTRWRFHLREAQWSDGVPVTAHDFVFGFQRILDPETLSEYAAVLYTLKNAEVVNRGDLPPTAVGVRALDDRTLDMELEYPASYMPSLLKHYTAYAVPRHAIERYGGDWMQPENIVVNGPYTLVRWWSNFVVHLKKSPSFYDARNVFLDDLYFYPTTDVNTAARLVSSGERGWSKEFPAQQVEELRAAMPGFVRVSPYLLMNYLSFNCTRPPFNDPRVRQAMAMAIDREFLAREIYRTGETPAYNFVPPGLANYESRARYRWADTPVDERRRTAVQLLEAAGFGPDNPLRFEFSHRTTSINPRVATVAQAHWRGLADWVRVDLAPTETQIHYANLRAKNFTVGDGGWVADFNDPKNYLFLLETRTGPQNYPGYSNPRYDALVAESDRVVDQARRQAMIAEAEQIMLDDCPVCTTVFGVSRNLVHPDLTGYVDNVEDIHRARWFGVKA